MPVCFRAHSGGGVACFCMSLLLLVQLLWIFVVLHLPTQKWDCTATTGPIDTIQSCNVSAYTKQPYFESYLEGCADCFCSSVFI